MLYAYFGEELREDIPAKEEFLLRRHVALWDVVSECTITGSSDASISDYTVADIHAVLRASSVRSILLNGATAYKIFCERFARVEVPYLRLPSTSPANPRYAQPLWFAALDAVFGRGG